MKTRKSIALVIIIAITGIFIYYIPDIYKRINNYDVPKVNKSKKVQSDESKIEPITLESDIVKNITIPIMHNDKYSKDSYFQKDSITINDFSNNDILYNAFIDIYEGYLVNHSRVGCANESKEFDATYLKSRIKNIIGKNVDYKLEDFTVPNVNKDIKYIGLWKYNSDNNTYVFYGNCNGVNNNTIYYELSNLYQVDSSDDNSVLYLYYHVGFVKEENNNFIIYNDADYINEVGSGKLKNEALDYNLNNFKTYKYTYKLGLCSYDNYCFYKGEWIND